MLLKIAHMSHVFPPSFCPHHLFLAKVVYFWQKAKHVSHTKNIGVRMIIKGQPYTSTKQSTVYGFSYLLYLQGV